MELPSLTKVKGDDLKWRLIRSGVLLLSYFAHGWTLGSLGPTMLDIQIRTSSLIDKVTFIIIGRAAGLTIGSFLAGPITSVIDIQLCIALALTVAGIATAAVPWPTNIAVTIGSFFVAGLGFGLEETSLYLYMLYLWGSECEPFMQALHFSFGVGASVAPLIAAEFILPRNESNPDQWKPEDVQVYWCYEIIALWCLAVAIIFFVLYVFAPKSSEHESRREKLGTAEIDKRKNRDLKPTISMIQRENEKRKSTMLRVLGILLLCSFCFFYCGIEVNFGAYLKPYAVDGPLKMTKTDGAYIAAVYWSVFTFSRLLTVFYIKKIGSRNNLILCTAILIFANVVLIPFYYDETCLWVGSVLIGLGASSVLASIFGYIELSIKMTPLITSFTIASGCLGQSIFPIITSQFFGVDPKIFLWLTLGAAIAMGISLALIIWSFNCYGKLMKERLEHLNERIVKPSFGRLNSVMSVASDNEKIRSKRSN